MGTCGIDMAELGWKTLKERRLQSKARLVYKITHVMAPTVLIELFSTSSVIRHHDHNLRNSNMNLYILFPKTDYLKNVSATMELNYGMNFLVTLKMLRA